MITDEQLKNIGFSLLGEYENDPYYKLYLENAPFGLKYLSGSLNEGVFTFYDMNFKKFDDMKELQKIFDINGFVVNKNVMSKL